MSQEDSSRKSINPSLIKIIKKKVEPVNNPFRNIRAKSTHLKCLSCNKIIEVESENLLLCTDCNEKDTSFEETIISDDEINKTSTYKNNEIEKNIELFEENNCSDFISVENSQKQSKHKDISSEHHLSKLKNSTNDVTNEKNQNIEKNLNQKDMSNSEKIEKEKCLCKAECDCNMKNNKISSDVQETTQVETINSNKNLEKSTNKKCHKITDKGKCNCKEYCICEPSKKVEIDVEETIYDKINDNKSETEFKNSEKELKNIIKHLPKKESENNTSELKKSDEKSTKNCVLENKETSKKEKIENNSTSNAKTPEEEKDEENSVENSSKNDFSSINSEKKEDVSSERINPIPEESFETKKITKNKKTQRTIEESISKKSPENVAKEDDLKSNEEVEKNEISSNAIYQNENIKSEEDVEKEAISSKNKDSEKEVVENKNKTESTLNSEIESELMYKSKNCVILIENVLEDADIVDLKEGSSSQNVKEHEKEEIAHEKQHETIKSEISNLNLSVKDKVSSIDSEEPELESVFNDSTRKIEKNSEGNIKIKSRNRDSTLIEIVEAESSNLYDPLYKNSESKEEVEVSKTKKTCKKKKKNEEKKNDSKNSSFSKFTNGISGMFFGKSSSKSKSSRKNVSKNEKPESSSELNKDLAESSLITDRNMIKKNNSLEALKKEKKVTNLVKYFDNLKDEDEE